MTTPNKLDLPLVGEGYFWNVREKLEPGEVQTGRGYLFAEVSLLKEDDGGFSIISRRLLRRENLTEESIREAALDIVRVKDMEKTIKALVGTYPAFETKDTTP